MTLKMKSHIPQGERVNFNMANTRRNKVGETNKNKYNTEMVIIRYSQYSDITVQFQDQYKYEKKTSYQPFLRGSVQNVYDKSIFNIGFLGEGPYPPSQKSHPTREYGIWHAIMQRCYEPSCQEKSPAYKGCTVDPEWHNFQNFAKWYDEKFYILEKDILEIDKDILVKGNKVYGPKTCCLVPGRINSIFPGNKINRGKYPVGVSFEEKSNKFTASCCRLVDGKKRTKKIGRYKTAHEAFLAYKRFKEGLIKQVAGEYKDLIPDKVYRALVNYVVEETD